MLVHQDLHDHRVAGFPIVPLAVMHVVALALST